VLARGCEIHAFRAGDDTSAVAECLFSQSSALDGLGRSKAALDITDRALAIFLRVDGEIHPHVAGSLAQRAALLATLGRTAEAAGDFERAIGVFEKLQLDPGHLADTKWSLAKLLWKRDPARAKTLLGEAIVLFGQASGSWAETKAEAEALLRTAR
jgi:tetratricopeptide (TPR) repeat protein